MKEKIIVWRNSEDELPGDGVYVLAKYAGDNWNDSTDQEGVDFKVVKFLREKASPNNKKDYIWYEFCGNRWFGQDFQWWSYINF